MKRNLIIVLIFNLVTLSVCNNNPSDNPGKELVSQNGLSGKVVNPSLLCYAFTNQKDTVLLKLKIDKSQVSGDLIYDYFEKD